MLNVLPNLVLIDDDELIRATWKMVAKGKGHQILCFHNGDEFLKSNIDHRVPIYVDYHLKGEESGFDLAKKLHKQGYKQIFIATGSNAHLLDAPVEVQKVIGKEYPL